MAYDYHGVVVYIVDGDTVDILADLGFKISFKVRVRLHGINTPELNSKDPEERDKAQKAKDFISSLIFNKKVYLNSKDLDKYGRSIGEIFLVDDLTKSVNQIMVDDGYAVPYMV